MRNIIVSEFVALDGVMEAPGGDPATRTAGCCPNDLAHIGREN